MSKLRGEKCVTFRRDLPHTCRKKIINVKYPLGKELENWWQREKTSCFEKAT